jgi:hypothetical protein
VTAPSVSIVIVSRHRAGALKRCLTGISQLQYRPFEVVVVADPEGIAAAQELPFAGDIKLCAFDEPNISAARNIGINHAAGEIVAFIDDDAVPEPQWLRHLVAPAANPAVAAMGGFVRGRNGISFQWTARRLDAMGQPSALNIDTNKSTLLHPPQGHAIKTEGTNMAFKRDTLIDLDGFDEAFHYFLDETDLNMRLARTGAATALVPLAEVHHGFQANAMRTATRVPTDLFDIGASWAVFQRKHIPESQHAPHWKARQKEERARLIRHLQQGTLEPRAVRRLMKRLRDGYEAGRTRALNQGNLSSQAVRPFQPFPSRRRESIWIASTPLKFRKDMEEARAQVAAGRIVTLCSLSYTALYHHIGFTNDGVWVQRGGVYGRSDRNTPIFRMTTKSRRQTREKNRVARQRSLGNDSI